MVLYRRVLDNGSLVVLLEDGTLLRDRSREWNGEEDWSVIEDRVNQIAVDYMSERADRARRRHLANRMAALAQHAAA